ncbi:hypothetical protein AAFF_G00341510 [Aldrovandia affinis]|uniref:Uncharacterized protein n=1 Tax=Aldrovandia affinis TaxID=143900 RepID=A0AAD7SKX6_9TELE|nr:hypothetical protein AAFF_G00341510 [Aldrovandia affinis]
MPGTWAYSPALEASIARGGNDSGFISRSGGCQTEASERGADNPGLLCTVPQHWGSWLALAPRPSQVTRLESIWADRQYVIKRAESIFLIPETGDGDGGRIQKARKPRTSYTTRALVPPGPHRNTERSGRAPDTERRVTRFGRYHARESSGGQLHSEASASHLVRKRPACRRREKGFRVKEAQLTGNGPVDFPSWTRPGSGGLRGFGPARPGFPETGRKSLGRLRRSGGFHCKGESATAGMRTGARAPAEAR